MFTYTCRHIHIYAYICIHGYINICMCIHVHTHPLVNRAEWYKIETVYGKHIWKEYLWDEKHTLQFRDSNYWQISNIFPAHSDLDIYVSINCVVFNIGKGANLWQSYVTFDKHKGKKQCLFMSTSEFQHSWICCLWNSE